MDLLWLKSLESSQLALSSTLFEDLLKPDRVTVRFGSMKIKLDVIVNNDLSEATVGLPLILSKLYIIPTDIPYECFLKDGELHIGPVIAYVVQGYFKQLSNKTLSIFLPRFKEYESIKGLIFICTADSIDIDQSLIEGYYYNPKGHQSGSAWKYGKFPLPNAIFNRSFLSQRKIKVLREEIGNTIFNSYWYNLNKWLIWERLSKNELLKKHLPYTEKFSGIGQLYDLLNKYESVYIKPLNQSRGRGILNVSKADEGILVIDEKKRRYNLKEDKSASQFLRAKLNRSIIQQAVPFRLGNQQLDFRVFLQRDKSKLWSFSGIILKISHEGSIITNTQGRAKILCGREALTTIYKMNLETAEKTENEIINLIKEAVKMYENQGIHIGDVAADIILDFNLHIWLLELQLNYAAEKAYDLPSELFKEIMVTPFKYAKALAGFMNDK